MLAQLGRWARCTLDFLLPQSCLGCGVEGEALCPACTSRLPRITPPVCARCGLPLPPGAPCPDCAQLDFAFDGLRAPFRFEKLVREAVHQLKYQNLRCLATPLAAELARYLGANPVPADILMPVPLHPRRERERGYNQSALLAQKLGPMLGLKVTTRDLRRAVHTPAQARAESVRLRRQLMADVFVCLPGALQGRKVLLIDDVATSGATMHHCALALKRSGAVSVWGLTVARELM
jgi:ComF family protein